MSESTISALSQMQSSDLRSVKDAISKSKTDLNTVKDSKQKSLKTLDIYIAPLISRQKKISDAVGETRAQVRVIPTEVVQDATELGRVNSSVEYSLSAKNQSAIDMLELIDNLNIEKAQLNLDISNIDSTITFLDSILSDINTVLGTRTD